MVQRRGQSNLVGILGAIEDTERLSQKIRTEPRGILRLTCGVEFGMIAVSRWIGECLERYPQVNLESDVTGRIIDLVHEGFDLAVRVGPLSDSSPAERVEAVPRLGINNSFAVRDAAVPGLGIAQLPLAIVGEQTAGGTLLRELSGWEPPAMPVHAVFPGTRYLTRKVRAFIDHAVQAFEVGHV